MSILTILDLLRYETGRNAKIAILQKHKGNQLLQKVFLATYDPYVTYYIKKIPVYTRALIGEDTISLDEAIDRITNVLATREKTGQEAIDYLQETLCMLVDDDARTLARIIEKDLDCGVQESTINKVWPNLIPTYPCLLAKAYDEKSIRKIRFPAYSQLKLDGMRVNVFNTNGAISFRGRSGKAVDLLGVLDDAIRAVLPSGYVLDGELVLEDNGAVMKRSMGNGILNKAIRGTISEEEARKVRVTAWDIIPIGAFRKAKCATPYNERLALLESLPKSTKIDVVAYKVVNSLDEAVRHFEAMLTAGMEGTILKNVNHIWEDKRSSCLVKMKAEKTADLEVVDWQEGTGKYAGMMGALICRSADSKVEVSIGSGFSDEQRQEWTRRKILGRIVEVMYNERIASKDRPNVDSLFLPRFMTIREDKSVANSSKEIK